MNNLFENRRRDEPAVPPEGRENREKVSMNILLAEDNDALSGFFIRVLTGMGCIVTLVKDGEALLNELADKAKNYDLLITDNTMPKVKGIEALKRIREDALFEHTKSIKVILNSSDVDGTLEPGVLSLDGVFLPKPVSLATLSEAVKEISRELKKPPEPIQERPA